MSFDGCTGARTVVRALFAATLALGGCSSGDGGDGGGGTDDDGTGDTAHSGSGGAAPVDCATECAEMGFDGGALEEGGCACGEPLDEACFLGTSAVCACDASIDQPCSDQDAFQSYVRCYQDVGTTRELFLCVVDYVEDTTIDCEAAKAACVP